MLRRLLFWLFISLLVGGYGVYRGDAAVRAQTRVDREALIARAQVWTPVDTSALDLRRGPDGPGSLPPDATVACDFVTEDLDGNSPKFECRTPDGETVRVKFGAANGEVYGEVAATRLLWALGFGADRMYPARVECRGCPPHIGEAAPSGGARVVTPAAIERKMAGRDVVSVYGQGWSWTELDLIDERRGGAPRAQRDALKLLAAFLQHTDSKPEQQRLLCVDEACTRTVMMLNDVGLTFGRANLANANAIGSVNLDAWARTPVWRGDEGCIANVTKSFSGTLRDPVIGESGRLFLARRLEQLSDAQLRDLFTAAHADQRGGARVDDWVRVFRAKQAAVASRRCATPWVTTAPVAFTIEPVLWVQSWSSPGLTQVMHGISFFGYTPVYVAAAVLLAFGYRVRLGAALLLLLALNGVFVDATKEIVSYPRPDAVDTRVRAMALTQPAAMTPPAATPEASSDANDAYGFPSGHVATTTAFLFGLALLFRWRWAWTAMLVAVPLMALSRIYLGRHFVGDVLGGVAVGIVATAVAVLGWRLAHIEHATRGWRVARRAVYSGIGLAFLAFVAGIPAPYDAGRLLGFAAGALIVARAGHDLDAAPLLVRVRRVALAAAVYLAAWWAMPPVVELFAEPSAPAAILAGTIPAFLLLPAPIYLERIFRLKAEPETSG